MVWINIKEQNFPNLKHNKNSNESPIENVEIQLFQLLVCTKTTCSAVVVQTILIIVYTRQYYVIRHIQLQKI